MLSIHPYPLLCWAVMLVGGLLLMGPPLSNGSAIDNELLGEPLVDCQDTVVTLTFNTRKPFTGRVYVKGLVDDDRCSRNFATNEDQSKFSMIVQNGDCNMQRQRVQGELEGIMFSLVIVVSFHGTFVTKVDRAFRCMCFFRNIKRVTNLLDMSMIGTTELLDTAKMPTCVYSIHGESPDGPLVRYAKVGDKIYHVWECDDEAQGFLVHTCWVNDGRGNKFDLLDIDGCAIDPIIQPDVKYAEDLAMAYVETHGYKFSDTGVLDYMCVLELCKKAQGECQGLVPPNCGRGKRAVDPRQMLIVRAGDLKKGSLPVVQLREATPENVMDVTSTLHMVDTISEDNNVASSPMGSDPADTDTLIASLNHWSVLAAGQEGPQELAAAPATPRLCLTMPALGLLLCGVVVVLLSALSTVLVMCNKQRAKSMA